MVAEGLLRSDAWTRFEVVYQNLTVRSVRQSHSWMSMVIAGTTTASSQENRRCSKSNAIFQN